MAGSSTSSWQLRVHWLDGSTSEFAFPDGKPERATPGNDSAVVLYASDDGGRVVELQTAAYRACELRELAGDA